MNRFHTTNQSTRAIQIGELVQIQDASSKRQLWRYGKVPRLMPGRDGITRLVKLKTNTGFLIRPIQKLYPLEILPDEAESTVSNHHFKRARNVTLKTTQQNDRSDIKKTKIPDSSLDHTDEGGEDVGICLSKRGRPINPHPKYT